MIGRKREEINPRRRGNQEREGANGYKAPPDRYSGIPELGELLKDKKQRDRANRERKIAGAVGAVAALGVAGEDAFKIGQGLGDVGKSTYSGVHLITQTKKNAKVELYLNRISQDIAKQYRDSHSFLQAAGIATQHMLDAAGRASENTPGAQSKPVQFIRGLKEKVFELTNPQNLSSKYKNKFNKRGTLDYTHHYNELNKIADNALFKLAVKDSSIEKQAEKILKQEQKNHKVNVNDLKKFENTVKEYNDTYKIVQSIRDLDVDSVYVGVQSAGYRTILETADRQQVSETGLYGRVDEGVGLAAAITVAYLGKAVAQRAYGSKAGKAIRYAASVIAKAGKYTARGVSSAGRRIGGKLKKIGERIAKYSEDRRDAVQLLKDINKSM